MEREALLVPMEVASRASNGWTSGVAGLEMYEGSVSASTWIVAKNPLALANGGVLATDFRVAFVDMSYTPSWHARKAHFTREQAAMGDGRCCGRQLQCDAPTIPDPPVCGGSGYCGSEAHVFAGSTGATEAGFSSGHGVREFTLYRGGLPVPTVCHGTLAPSCVNTNGMCGLEVGGDFSQIWDAPLPNGTGSCGGAGEAPTGGRVPPRQCLYANSTETTIGGGQISSPGGHLPECDGRCFNCEDVAGPMSSDFRPRQCNLMTFAPGTPGAPGSGVCDSSPAAAIAEYQAWIVLIGANGTACEPVGGRGLELCTTCVENSGCTRFMRRAGSVVQPPQPGSVFSGSETASSGTDSRTAIFDSCDAPQLMSI